MRPRLHAAVHLPSHGSVTISPNWDAFEAVSHSSLEPFKCQTYTDRSTPEHYSCPPFSILTMQNDSSQKSSGFHHPESASGNSTVPTDASVAPVSTNTPVPDYPYGWSPADVPVIGGNSLTAFAETAARFPRVARPRAARECAPPASFMNCDRSLDAYHWRPCAFAAEPERTNPRAPQTEWERSHLAGMQSNGSQVPSDLNVSEGAWSHRANNHAVVGPAQHASLHETNYLSCDIPAPPHMPTSSPSSTGPVHTSFDGVRCWMATSLLGQVPSQSHHRRRFRRSHPHPDRVICDQCQKQMRPQSLKRHIREVHDRVKRHVKSGFRAGP